MSEELHSRLHDEELAFFARMGAAVSHDMRNVLAIIGEYAGLIDDLLGMAKRKKLSDPDKIKEVTGNIARQVGKGTEVMERFSRFAHAADERTASFDLASLVGNLAALARRRVDQAGCRLQTDVPDRPVPAHGNPFRLQYALFCALRLVLDCPTRSDDRITVKLVSQAEGAAIHVSGQMAGSFSNSELTAGVGRLSAALAELSGNAATNFEEGVLSVILTVPLRGTRT
jgi:C4-dicarboxylate-specific signal transduction histidine kinase